MMTPDGGGGGGMHHGGMKMKGMKKSTGDAPGGGAGGSMQLSAAAKTQLDELKSAYAQLLDAVETPELPAALETFSKTLESVDATLLTGQMHMTWMEYAMRLRNDVMEVNDNLEAKDLPLALASLQANMKKLQQKLDIQDQESGHVMAKISTPPAFQEQLNGVYNAYLEVQAALVADALPKAIEATENVRTRLAQVDMKLLEGDAHMKWMEAQKKLAQSIADMKDANDLDAIDAALRNFLATDDKPTIIVCATGVERWDA